MRYLDEGEFHPDAFASEDGWAEDLDAADLTDALRSSLSEEYADASDEEIDDALANVLDSMSAAEAFNFTSALNRIGKSASQLASDPTFAAVAQTALPILGSAAGTMIAGPAGTGLGAKFGSLAASALPTRPAAAPAPPRPVPAPPAPPPPVPAPAAAAAAAAPAAAGVLPSAPGVTAAGAPATPAGPTSPVAGGSTAAAQGLVLTQQPDVLRSLLATALGQHGRQTVSGVPVPQVLGMLSQVFGEAAADADELMYLGQHPDAAESVLDEAPADATGSLYADLLGADNLELAEAAEWDWPDR